MMDLVILEIRSQIKISTTSADRDLRVVEKALLALGLVTVQVCDRFKNHEVVGY